ncbi:MAG: cysteine-rich KTR domain-containing protein [Oscillospiraceae bacterium]|nr:cysteine-rich KTR domain-containing protein [Oscillospiraceae bacterium]
MRGKQWIWRSICGNKIRLKIREDTGLKNFPLFCPKCKPEALMNIRQFNMSVIKKPDAKTQSR